MKGLKSRKLWMTLGAVAVAVLVNFVGLDADTAKAVVDSVLKIALGYVAAEAVVDAAAALKK